MLFSAHQPTLSFAPKQTLQYKQGKNKIITSPLFIRKAKHNRANIAPMNEHNTNTQRSQVSNFTFQMVEEVIVDVASCLWSTVPIVNTDESAVRARVKKAQWTRLDLTLVLK
jgi:hypothetical protein